jgi:hypothetical protein
VTNDNQKVSALWHLRNAGAVPYLGSAVAVVGLSLYLSVSLCTWIWLMRSGGVIILLGVMLGFRRLFRIGAREYPTDDQPLVIGNRFNIVGMWQRVERLTDSFAQALGLWLIALGTVLASYGDVILNWLLPLQCAG